jgi:hypothetical protein
MFALLLPMVLPSLAVARGRTSARQQQTADKDKDKKDQSSKPEALAKAEGKFPAGQWHTLLVEIDGARVSVQADNGAKLTASHPGLDVEKTGYRFVTKGQSLLLDDLTIWQVAK